jgi:hypothetical protein
MERNVSEVLGERDFGRRGRATGDLYAEDCTLYDADESIGQAAVSDRVGILGERPPALAFSLVDPAEVICTSAACAHTPAQPELLRSSAAWTWRSSPTRSGREAASLSVAHGRPLSRTRVNCAGGDASGERTDRSRRPCRR